MQAAEIQQNNPVDAIGFFRMKVGETTNPKTAGSLAQALNTFVRFLGGRQPEFGDFSEDLLSDWLSFLLAESYTAKTMAYYLKNLSSLYGKAVREGIAGETEAFARLRARVMMLADSGTTGKTAPELIAGVRKLIAGAEAGDGPRASLSRDLTAFAILAGGLSFDRLAHYRKDDYKDGNEVACAIVARYSRPRNKYLFPLHQSERTPAQMRRYLRAEFSAVFAGLRLGIACDDDAAAEIWSRVAVSECGVSPSEAAACLGLTPQDNPAYIFARPVDLDEDEKQQIRENVAAVLSENPSRWFAMRLRPGVGVDSLRERLAQLPAGVAAPEIYYPSEEIARRVGKKIVMEEKPVVPGLVFFRSRMSDVAPLFRNIGDIAWCYRTGRAGATGAYAVIPNAQMYVFQRTIGLFAPGMELRPVGTTPLQPGDHVEVIGGSFIGRRGVISSVHTGAADGTPASGRTICRLLLPDNNGIEWTVTAPSELLRRM